MKEYKGLEENDLKVIQIALNKLPITGAEAQMMVGIQQKIQMEIELLKTPKRGRPKKTVYTPRVVEVQKDNKILSFIVSAHLGVPYPAAAITWDSPDKASNPSKRVALE